MFAGAYFAKRYYPASYFPPTAGQVAWLVAMLGGAANVSGTLSAYIQFQPDPVIVGAGGGGSGYAARDPRKPRVAREKAAPAMNVLADDDDIMQIIAAFLHLVGHE